MLVRSITAQLTAKASFSVSAVLLLMAVLVSPGARAGFDLTSYMEVILVENVGNSWTTVPLENTYSNAIPICTYVLGTFAGSAPNYTNVPAVTRIQNITSSSFQLRIQGWEDSGATASNVHCMIVDEGVHTLPDGRKLEAHTVVSDRTTGQNGDSGAWQVADLENVSGDLVHTFNTPAPFESNFADGICVGKHIGLINGQRVAETLGYVVAEAGSGTVNNIFYELALGADSIGGNTGNNSGYTYGVSRHHTIAVLNQAGEDGGHGSWAVLYGNDPLAGNNIDLAVDEEIVAGDSSRVHTREPVFYWAFAAAELTLRKNLINNSGGTASLALTRFLVSVVHQQSRKLMSPPALTS